jgi:hypothetical protein
MAKVPYQLLVRPQQADLVVLDALLVASATHTRLQQMQLVARAGWEQVVFYLAIEPDQQ